MNANHNHGNDTGDAMKDKPTCQWANSRMLGDCDGPVIYKDTTYRTSGKPIYCCGGHAKAMNQANPCNCYQWKRAECAGTTD